MKIFITFSGERSKALAIAIREWLPKVLQAVEPWMSEHDVDKGRRWGQTISNTLSETNFGIVCLTSENLNSPWIHFESGALAKSVEESFLWTYLLDVEYSDIAEPLGQFQHTKSNKEDTKKLLITINKLLGDKHETNLQESQLNETYEMWWPKLEAEINKITTSNIESQKRSDHEILKELLEITRAIARTRDESLINILNEAKMYAQQVAKEEAIKEASDTGRVLRMLR